MKASADESNQGSKLSSLLSGRYYTVSKGKYKFVDVN